MASRAGKAGRWAGTVTIAMKRACRVGQAGRVCRVGQAGRVGRVGQAGRVGRVSQAGRVGQASRVGRVGQAGRDPTDTKLRNCRPDRSSRPCHGAYKLHVGPKVY